MRERDLGDAKRTEEDTGVTKELAPAVKAPTEAADDEKAVDP